MDALIEICTIIFVSSWLLYRAGRFVWSFIDCFL